MWKLPWVYLTVSQSLPTNHGGLTSLATRDLLIFGGQPAQGARVLTHSHMSVHLGGELIWRSGRWRTCLRLRTPHLDGVRPPAWCASRKPARWPPPGAIRDHWSVDKRMRTFGASKCWISIEQYRTSFMSMTLYISYDIFILIAIDPRPLRIVIGLLIISLYRAFRPSLCWYSIIS